LVVKVMASPLLLHDIAVLDRRDRLAQAEQARLAALLPRPRPGLARVRLALLLRSLARRLEDERPLVLDPSPLVTLR
jgi:hypothetical protein